MFIFDFVFCVFVFLFLFHIFIFIFTFHKCMLKKQKWYESCMRQTIMKWFSDGSTQNFHAVLIYVYHMFEHCFFWFLFVLCSFSSCLCYVYVCSIFYFYLLLFYYIVYFIFQSYSLYLSFHFYLFLIIL